jgi:hypothetical protein
MTSRAQEIIDSIPARKLTYISMNLGLVSMFTPGAVMLVYRQLLGMKPGKLPAHMYRRDGSLYGTFDSEEILAGFPHLPGAPARLQRMFPLFLITELHHELIGANLVDRSPLMEFLRHLRNAAAHGNHWHFRADEPKRPAALRDLSLDRSFHGQEVFFETLAQGDFLDLLDDVQSYLRKPAT